MIPRISPLRLSIVDFIGVFLPGAAWALLLITTLEVFNLTELTSDSTPLSIVRRLLGVSPSPPAGPSFGLPFYTGLALFALFLGYLVKAASARPADWVAFHLHYILSPKFRSSCKEKTDEYRFPYSARYRDMPYFSSLGRIISERLGHDWERDRLPGYQPFESCKRLLRVYAPALWEESQEREAQIRFLVSLSLASLYSIALSLWALVQAVLRKHDASGPLVWALDSVVVSVLLSNTLWTRRHREVEDVYLSTLIADRLPSVTSTASLGQHVEDEGDEGE
ncbi:MAG: hypothetical protein WAM82_22770 [Thermoanaerobaculia bacterium]